MRRQLATVLEIMSIFVGGLLAARAVVQSLGLRSTRETIANLGSGATPDFLQLAMDAAATYVIRYGILLALAFAAAYLFARTACLIMVSVPSVAITCWTQSWPQR